MYKAALVIVAWAIVVYFAMGTAKTGTTVLQNRAAAIEAAAQ